MSLNDCNFFVFLHFLQEVILYSSFVISDSLNSAIVDLVVGPLLFGFL